MQVERDRGIPYAALSPLRGAPRATPFHSKELQRSLVPQKPFRSMCRSANPPKKVKLTGYEGGTISPCRL
jgi:hypothetical protein